MTGVWISEWEWDDDNVGHLADRGLGVADVLDVWRGDPKYRRNKKGRAASHQMIGPTSGGTFLALFVVENQMHTGLWRAVTGRRAEEHEIDWWRRS